MIIKLKENDPDKLLRTLKAHWDERSKTNIGNVVDFVDELMKQSGFATYFYHTDFWAPISIVRKKEFETEDNPDDFITEIEIDAIIDEQMTGQKVNYTEYNTWHGKFGQKSEIVLYLNGRYSHYMKLAVKKFNLPSEKKEVSIEKGETTKENIDIDDGETRCFICAISDEEELLIQAKKKGKNIWICSKCLPRTAF